MFWECLPKIVSLDFSDFENEVERREFVSHFKQNKIWKY